MSPAERRASQLRGTLDLLILKSLDAQPLHGVGVVRRIHQMTNATIEVSYGSLFPALHRLEEAGWLAAEWQASEHNRRAKYYRLTPSGRRHLAREEREWRRIVDILGTALGS